MVALLQLHPGHVHEPEYRSLSEPSYSVTRDSTMLGIHGKTVLFGVYSWYCSLSDRQAAANDREEEEEDEEEA